MDEKEKQKLPNVSMDLDDVPEIINPADSQTDNNGGEGTPETPEIKPETDDSGKEIPKEQPDAEDGEGTPRFKERIEQVKTKVRDEIQKEYEEKYKRGADSWEQINEIAAEDPEFALLMIEKLEKKGAMPTGTFVKAKASYEEWLKKNPKEDDKPKDNSEAPENQEDPKFLQALNEHPAVKFAEAQRKEASEKIVKEAEDKENWLKTFESDKPDIEKAENPALIRSTIYAQAQVYMSKNKELSEEDAMNKAYKFVLHTDEVLEEYKENGVIEGLVRNNHESATPAGGGGSGSSRKRALSVEEKDAARLSGMSEDDYTKYADSSSGYVD